MLIGDGGCGHVNQHRSLVYLNKRNLEKGDEACLCCLNAASYIIDPVS